MQTVFLPIVLHHGGVEGAAMVQNEQEGFCAPEYEASPSIRDPVGCARGNAVPGSPKNSGQHLHPRGSSRGQGNSTPWERQQPPPSPPASTHSGSSANSLTPSLRLALRAISSNSSASGSSDSSSQRQWPTEEPPRNNSSELPPPSSSGNDTWKVSSDDNFRIGHDRTSSSEGFDTDDLSSSHDEPGHPETASVALSGDSHDEIASRVPRDDVGELTSHVPLDDNGQLTSIGSVDHCEGQCQPCVFLFTSVGCSNGVACHCCHFPHGLMDSVRRRSGRKKRRNDSVGNLSRRSEQDPDAVVVGTGGSVDGSLFCPTPTRANVSSDLRRHESTRRWDVEPSARAALLQRDSSQRRDVEWRDVESGSCGPPFAFVPRAASPQKDFVSVGRLSL